MKIEYLLEMQADRFLQTVGSYTYSKRFYANESDIVMLRVFSKYQMRVLHMYLLYKFLRFYGY
jgi:hypothetical protein